MLLDQGVIDERVVANMLTWHHTSFSAYLSGAIPREGQADRENLARYMAHPAIVPSRLLGVASAGKVIYTAEAIHPRHHANFRAFDPLDFLAELTSHIPDPHEKTALYYGWYSNRTRGFRKARGLLKVAAPVASPSAEAARPPVAVRPAWARLIRKIYAADPLVCPRCGGRMQVIAVIEQDDVIFRILSHLGLVSAEDPSRAPPMP